MGFKQNKKILDSEKQEAFSLGIEWSLFVILDKPDWPLHEVGTHINNKCLDVYFVRKGYILMFIHVIIHYSYVPAAVTRSQLFITLWLYSSLTNPAAVFTGP